MIDRFSQRHWKEKPIRYDPSNYEHKIRALRACDVCEEGHAGIFEAPEKVKIKWCRYCDNEVRTSFKLTEDDVEYV